jgi:hypothetical protein
LHHSRAVSLSQQLESMEQPLLGTPRRDTPLLCQERCAVCCVLWCEIIVQQLLISSPRPLTTRFTRTSSADASPTAGAAATTSYPPRMRPPGPH